MCPAKVDVVEVDTYTGFEEGNGINLADTTNVNNRVVGVSNVQAQIRYQRLQIAECIDLVVLKIVG